MRGLTFYIHTGSKGIYFSKESLMSVFICHNFVEVVSIGERDVQPLSLYLKLKFSLRKSRRGLKQRMKISRDRSP